MNKEIIYLLILIIIIQFIILYFVLKRRGSGSPVGLEKKQPSDNNISKEACEELGGTDRDGRCIVTTVKENRECITDIGKIYEENKGQI